MSKKLGVALIGAGAVSGHHVNAWRQIENVEVIGVYRRDEQKAKEFAEKHNVGWTANFDDYFNNPDVDILDITLPSGLHADIGIKAANAGKHVVVEKPIDVTLEKADALIKACQQNDVTLGVISQNRFLDDMQKIYSVVQSGGLGALIQGDAYIKWHRPQAYYDSAAWRGTYKLDGGGPFINQGIHFIDLLLSVMGPVKSVFGKTRTAAHDIEVEDNGSALLEFMNGAFGVIQASTATWPGLPARLDIHGSKGTLSLEGENLAFMHIDGQEPYKAADKKAGGASKPMDIDLTPFIRQFQNIVDAINEHKEPLVNGAAGRQALELILTIYESSRTGKTIYLN